MKLKPCPFCKGEARLVEPEEQAHCVECSVCWASSRMIYSLKEDARPLVVEAWNKRPGEEDLEDDHPDGYEQGNPQSLTLEEAKEVWEYKRHSSWRALSFRFLGRDDQMDGRDLARDAACRLLNMSLEQLYSIEWGKDPVFDKLHASYVGDNVYWWE